MVLMPANFFCRLWSPFLAFVAFLLEKIAQSHVRRTHALPTEHQSQQSARYVGRSVDQEAVDEDHNNSIS